MSDEHTSTPWEACERGDYSDYAAVFDDADAALIVKAVNAHDDVVSAALGVLERWAALPVGRQADLPSLGLGPLRDALTKHGLDERGLPRQ